MSSLPGPEMLIDLFNGEQSFFNVSDCSLIFPLIYILCVLGGGRGWRSENSLWELVLSLQCVGFGDQTLVICLGDAHHCPLLCISGPKVFFFFHLLQSI